MSLIDDAVALLAKLPLEAVSLVVSLIKGAQASDDPVRYLQRRIVADAAHAAAQATVREALERAATSPPPDAAPASAPELEPNPYEGSEDPPES